MFLSPSDRRLRAGWRILLHLLLFGALWAGLSAPWVVILAAVFGLGRADPGLLDPANPQSLLSVVLSVVAAVALTAATWIARRFLDRRTFLSLGLAIDRHTLPDLAFGFGLPLLQMGAIFAFEWSMGWIDAVGFAWETAPPVRVLTGALLGLAAFILVGYQEELLARGYQLQNLAEGLNLPAGVVISSAIFAVYHALNPHTSWISTLGIFAAGLFLAYGWLRTRSLWLPIGLHIGWNFFEGNVFGFAVSGLEIEGLLRHTSSGPELITGGAFGPEAGLVVLPALALGAGVIWVYTQGRSVHAGQGSPAA
jgi:hypothetical protein